MGLNIVPGKSGSKQIISYQEFDFLLLLNSQV